MTRALRLIFLTVCSICFASAVCFALLRYGLSPSDEFAAFNHPAQPWALDVHIVSSVALTLVLGFLFGVHALPRLAGESRARTSGLGLIVVAALMLASGALLPCSAGVGERAVLAWTHGISGALFALLVPMHVYMVRRAKSLFPDVFAQGCGSLRRAPTPRSNASAAACHPLALR